MRCKRRRSERTAWRAKHDRRQATVINAHAAGSNLIHINRDKESFISEVVNATLDPGSAPRDGVTVLGGEPFLQPEGLLPLVTALKAHGQHVTLYSDYTLEELVSLPDPVIAQIIDLADILIDGPFVKELSGDAGEWRGSTNQRIIQLHCR